MAAQPNRLGSNELIRYNLRIICASNKDLRAEIHKGNFREDLFFRLFSVEIRLPALRERKGDIVPLSMSFLEDISNLFGKKIAGFSPEVLNVFENYSWPGNIRQLRREIERLVALTPQGELISPDKCSPELLTPPNQTLPESVRLDDSLGHQVQLLETRLIAKALQETAGNRLKAATLLGITRQGLYKKMKRYQIAH
ncbi:MAG: sigma-54-dependent Fis family transcriptional regulator [Desulfobacterales bacterium]|uniref:Sigma-54-dependent Fis family transcriptional regulator n=1 Tax=Candidatus Desulfatibia profunda TaxID=2841695 RepID=A0A8J6TP66_9BACT|nr:sigma-54-dependent Fis family transcriptional regulator [Candidatus Desulfatibia profunda]MBL7181080.1 sigma-54-dependent Fis family transcriptional regulator [Desulfobacterales bacterium]